MLTSNLYISQIPSLSQASLEDVSRSSEMSSKSPTPSPAHSLTGGNLSDITSDDESIDSEPEDEGGNWQTKLRFILSCLSYTVGLGNIWRFPYLVYRNGGGVFFIPYLVLLLFCGVPLVFMEMAFGQYASLGPITIWKAVPLFKGIGYAVMIIQAIVAVYYNMINAWAFHYLFSSMNAPLPWSVCGNDWNSKDCRDAPVWLSNCSWVNETYLQQVNETQSQCVSLLQACINDTKVFSSSNVTACISWLEGQLGDGIYLPHRSLSEFKEPSEEYFYNEVLARSDGLQSLGDIQWQLALYLLLCWIIVFLCLLKGINSSGKLAYVVVIISFLLMLVMLIQAVVIDGHLVGVKFYVTPDWGKLLDLQVWVDAASQVFFSLSVSAGGLCAMSSYNSFYNNIYRDAVIVCVVDTLFSVQAGFLMFSSLGILASELNTTISNLVDSNVGLVFMAFPASVGHFDLPLMWSIVFFIMILLMGLSTMLTLVETVVTAILDEFPLLRTKSWCRAVVLTLVCCVLYTAGLPLTSQAGLYLIQLLDEFCSGIPLLITGLFMCLALAWIFNVQQLSRDIKQMTGAHVSIGWRVIWVFITPAVIVVILVLYIIKGISLDTTSYPNWSYSIGIVLIMISVSPIPIYVIWKLVTSPGSLCERLRQACESADDWGPSIVTKGMKNIDFYPTLNTQSVASNSCPNSPVLPVRKSSDQTHSFPVNPKILLEHTSYFSFPGILSMKKPHLDMRHRAILNQAFSASNGSIDKLPHHVTITESQHRGMVMFIGRKATDVDTCDKAIQTDAKSYTRALKRGSLKPTVHQMTIEEATPVSTSSHRKPDIEIEELSSWSMLSHSSCGVRVDEPVSHNKHVLEVEVQMEHL